jgi:hypothetical protein
MNTEIYIETGSTQQEVTYDSYNSVTNKNLICKVEDTVGFSEVVDLNALGIIENSNSIVKVSDGFWIGGTIQYNNSFYTRLKIKETSGVYSVDSFISVLAGLTKTLFPAAGDKFYEVEDRVTIKRYNADGTIDITFSTVTVASGFSIGQVIEDTVNSRVVYTEAVLSTGNSKIKSVPLTGGSTITTCPFDFVDLAIGIFNGELYAYRYTLSSPIATTSPGFVKLNTSLTIAASSGLSFFDMVHFLLAKGTSLYTIALNGGQGPIKKYNISGTTYTLDTTFPNIEGWNILDNGSKLLTYTNYPGLEGVWTFYDYDGNVDSNYENSLLLNGLSNQSYDVEPTYFIQPSYESIMLKSTETTTVTNYEYEKLDLFKDENININLKQKDLTDISKIFSPYSQSFSIPASDKNNRLLNYFYDTRVLRDSNSYFNAKIYVKGNLFKKGLISINDAKLNKLRPSSYSVNFFTKVVDLKTKFGDKTIGEVFKEGGVTNFYSYTTQNIFNGLTSPYAKIPVPLASIVRVWNSDAGTADLSHNTAGHNINFNYANYYNTQTNNSNVIGVKYNEVRPSVNYYSLLKDLFKSINITLNLQEFNTQLLSNIYAWCNGEVVVEKRSTLLTNNYSLTEGTGTKYGISQNSNGVITITRNAAPVPGETAKLTFTFTRVSGSGIGVPTSEFQVFANLTPEVGTVLPAGLTTERPLTLIGNQYSTVFDLPTDFIYDYPLQFKINFRANSIASFNATLTFKANYGTSLQLFSASGNSNLLTGYTDIDLYQMLPKIKAIDFFSSFTKTFNARILEGNFENEIRIVDGENYAKNLLNYKEDIERTNLSSYVESGTANIGPAASVVPTSSIQGLTTFRVKQDNSLGDSPHILSNEEFLAGKPYTFSFYTDFSTVTGTELSIAFLGFFTSGVSYISMTVNKATKAVTTVQVGNKFDILGYKVEQIDGEIYRISLSGSANEDVVNGSRNYITSTNLQFYDVAGVQLEKGTRATPYIKKDVQASVTVNEGVTINSKIKDYTDYIDIKQTVIKPTSLYKNVTFSHKGAKYLSNEAYKTANVNNPDSKEYGQLIQKATDPFLKDNYEIKTEYAISVPRTIPGTDNNYETVYGFTKDWLDEQYHIYKPNTEDFTLFFRDPINQNIPTTGNNVLSFCVESQYIVPFNSYNRMTPFFRDVITLKEYSLTFKDEVDVRTNLTKDDTLFSRFYGYDIDRVYNTSSRYFEWEGYLPATEIANFSLDNIIRIGKVFYTIEDASINLVTGKSKFTLMNLPLGSEYFGDIDYRDTFPPTIPTTLTAELT